jgi:hypothetical protein
MPQDKAIIDIKRRPERTDLMVIVLVLPLD